MATDLLMCGKVIEVNGDNYLIRLKDGTTRYVMTDNWTFGNGQAHQGEDVYCQVRDDGQTSTLTRAFFIPCELPINPFISAMAS